MNRIKLHEKFWNGETLDKLPVSFRIGDYFFADKFKAAKHLLVTGKQIRPEMIIVDDFLEDYDMMYDETQKTGQTGFFAAEPYVAIPWMEAIMGCGIYAGNKSFISKPTGEITDTWDNRWFDKYIEFLEKLTQLSKGRFPVAQPIMRGISDTLGAMLGQEKLIYLIYDRPDYVQKLAEKVCCVFLEVIKRQYKVIEPFHGGYSIGFYHVWSPGRCIWFQEDLLALMSPEMYAGHIKPYNELICEKYKYSAFHMHPSAFHVLDEILSIKCLDTIEVNKDVGGPGIMEMMHVFKKIIDAEKSLIIWGDLDSEDIDAIKKELPPKRIFLNIVAENTKYAAYLCTLV